MKKKETLEDIYDDFMNPSKEKSEAEFIEDTNEDLNPIEDTKLDLELDEDYDPLSTESLEVDNSEPYMENDEEELQKEIFSDENFKEIKKIIDEESFEDIEEDRELESNEVKNGIDKKIVIAVVIVILLLLMVISFILFFKKDDKKDPKPTNPQSNSNTEIPYEDIMKNYGDKVLEKVQIYYLENNVLPDVLPEATIEGYIITCEEEEIYDENSIYLGTCTINDSEVKYSYGEKKSIIEPIDTNTNSNSNTNSASNSNTNTNTNTNSSTNKPSNSNSNKPSNTTKPSNSNTTPTTASKAITSTTGGKKNESQFGSISIIPKDTPTAGEHPGCKSFEECYGGVLTYDTDGSLLLKSSKSPILMYNIPSSSKIEDAYSVNLTVKGAINQGDQYGASIVGISLTDANYLLWIGYKAGNLVVYSYGKNVENTKEIPLKDFDNKVVNIQVTATRGGKTNVYINGVLKSTFNSGTEKLAAKFVTIGDLRPWRNLKFEGNLYEFNLYDRVLNDNEIATNFEASKKYGIK